MAETKGNDKDKDARLEQLEADVTDLKAIIKTHTEWMERKDEFFKQWGQVLRESVDKHKEKWGED